MVGIIVIIIIVIVIIKDDPTAYNERFSKKLVRPRRKLLKRNTNYPNEVQRPLAEYVGGSHP